MHSRDNWDDLRFVLAVARNGSVSAAGKELGVNHATVLRRVAAFEERHGIEFFQKSVRGYRVVPEYAPVLEAIVEAENALFGVSRAVSGASAPLSGLVRVTSTDSFCATFLPEIIGEIKLMSPDLQISLMSSNTRLDLSRMDADISVRPAKALPDDLDGVIAARLDAGVYEPVEGDQNSWLGLDGPLMRSVVAEWMQSEGLDQNVTASTDSFVTLQRLAGAGLGRAILPCFMAARDPNLRRSAEYPVSIAVPIWVATHKDLGAIPRVAAVKTQLIERISARAQSFMCNGIQAP